MDSTRTISTSQSAALTLALTVLSQTLLFMFLLNHSANWFVLVGLAFGVVLEFLKSRKSALQYVDVDRYPKVAYILKANIGIEDGDFDKKEFLFYPSLAVAGLVALYSFRVWLWDRNASLFAWILWFAVGYIGFIRALLKSSKCLEDPQMLSRLPFDLEELKKEAPMIERATTEVRELAKTIEQGANVLLRLAIHHIGTMLEIKDLVAWAEDHNVATQAAQDDQAHVVKSGKSSRRKQSAKLRSKKNDVNKIKKAETDDWVMVEDELKKSS